MRFKRSQLNKWCRLFPFSAKIRDWIITLGVIFFPLLQFGSCSLEKHSVDSKTETSK
jgi:hypothetical protein